MNLTRLVPGNQLRTLPGGTWNQFCDATDFVNQLRRNGANIPVAAGATNSWRQTVDVVAPHDLKIGDVVYLNFDRNRIPDDAHMDRAMQPLVFTARMFCREMSDGFRPDSPADFLWGVVNRPIAANQMSPGAVTVRGPAFAKVAVHATTNYYCGPVLLREGLADDAPQLTNAPGSYGAVMLYLTQSFHDNEPEDWGGDVHQDAAAWALIDVGRMPNWQPAAVILRNSINEGAGAKIWTGDDEPLPQHEVDVLLSSEYAAEGTPWPDTLFFLPGNEGVAAPNWELYRGHAPNLFRPMQAMIHNYTGSRIYASEERPRMAFGFVGWLGIDGYLGSIHLTSADHGAVVHGRAQAAVTSGDITLENVERQIGMDPWWWQIVNTPAFDREAQTLVVKNPFGFAVAEGGLVRAVENDYGDWQAVQAECP